MYLKDLLTKLIEYALVHHLIDEDQIKQSEDKLGEMFLVKNFVATQSQFHIDYTHMMKELIDIAYRNKQFQPDSIDERDAYEAKIIDAVMPSPERVRTVFKQLYKVNPGRATDYLYRLSVDVNYIKKNRLKENISWNYPGKYGHVQMTINLAKPEKDPKDIARALLEPTIIDINIPKCVICKENEQNYYNARMNLRMAPVMLGHELWYFQYSPYQYYNEHAIILHEEHRPMKIWDKTFEYLFDFVDQFPTYFIGSNADLPIVGGSILNHDHFQAGKHHFPIEEAVTIKTYTWQDIIKVEHIKWPLSTVRLSSTSREKLSELASKFLHQWKSYACQELNIVPFTEQTPHNTITPIVRKNHDTYVLDIVFRNNNTNDQYPDGIFHPHQDVHHIKKENIGLIEAMGLAILPGRLKKELELIKTFLHSHTELPDDLIKHKAWINELQLVKDVDDQLLLEQVSQKFERVLEDSGVFKLTELGNKKFHLWIEHILQS
ncbi:MAG: UDP-glucose--hexose-1-phosphate uridylyltransferase [Firmicutes bacterium]|nr:UDP-glucose--hexose-1-phosphate uridylyltransferase [Bacillota bacterium]